MVYQNNNNGWVVFAIIAMIICGILGLILGIDRFGPAQDIREQQAGTQIAITVRAAEGVFAATQTPQAGYIQMTAVADNLTAVPLYQTATKVYEEMNKQNDYATATQAAWFEDQRNQHAASEATRGSIARQSTLDAQSFVATSTAMAQASMEPQNNTPLVYMGMVAAGAFWILSRAWVNISKARAKEKIASAHKEFAEQRRIKAVNASRQWDSEKKIIPQSSQVSLIHKPGNGHRISSEHPESTIHKV